MKRNIKKIKPKFQRTDSNKYNFKSKWRKPRGGRNKIRLGKRGHQKKPRIGYGMPKNQKHLDANGLFPILISSINEISSLNPSLHIAVISSTIGKRKKIILLEKIKSKNIMVSNIKNIDQYINDLKIKKKQLQQITKQKEEKKKKEKEKLTEKSEKKKEEKQSPEEHKKEEQKIEQEILKKEKPKPSIRTKELKMRETKTRKMSPLEGNK